MSTGGGRRNTPVWANPRRDQPTFEDPRLHYSGPGRGAREGHVSSQLTLLVSQVWDDGDGWRTVRWHPVR